MELTKIAIGDDQIMLGSSVISDQWEVSFYVFGWKLVGWLKIENAFWVTSIVVVV